MTIIPAIDLKDGKCVRLLQGRKNDLTVYSDDPACTALKWQSCGADYLHVVDLDGAFSGNQQNLSSIQSIRNAVKMTIEVGGGIRDMQRIDLLMKLGIDRVILGTVAVQNSQLVKEACKKYPGKILVGIDAKDGLVAIKGWVEITELKAIDLALRMQDIGVAGIIYTDISKDGMLTGPNLEATAQIVQALQIPVIASGGISSIEDIKNLMTIQNLWGAITGKAIYTGAIDLAAAIKLTKKS